MGKWGQKSRWAKSFFTACAVNGGGGTTPTPDHMRSAAVAVSHVEDEARTDSRLWMCNRCSACIEVPVDKVTKRLAFVVLSQHLEGSCTSVPVCGAGRCLFSADSEASPIVEDDSAMAARAVITDTLWIRGSGVSTGEKDAASVFVAIVNPKTPANIGSILRAVDCYKAQGVFYSGSRLNEALRHCPTDTRQSVRHIPFVHIPDMDCLLDVVEKASDARCGPSPPQAGESQGRRRVAVIAVDLIDGAQPLPLFQHPDMAVPRQAEVVVYIFGPEDGSIAQGTLARCSYAVYVPTVGSMNLAASVNVLLYDRCAKALVSKSATTSDSMCQAPAATGATKRTRDPDDALTHSRTSAPTEATLTQQVMQHRNPNNRTSWPNL